MSKSFTMPTGMDLKIVQHVYRLHFKLAKTIIQRRVRAVLAERGVSLSASAIEDLEDDALARSWELFCRKFREHKRPVDALRHAARVAARRVASRRLTALGSPRVKGYVDALDHRGVSKRVGLEDMPARHAVTELAQADALAEFDRTIATLPPALQKTVEYASRGVSAEDSATLQGVSTRTVERRYAALRNVLGQRVVYGMLCSAVNEAFVG